MTTRATLALVALGGALGSLARWGLAEATPHRPGQIPWATFVANATGALLLGVLMAAVTTVGRDRPALRPFLGVGVLGGYTTFSTYAADAHGLLDAGRPGLAGAYLAGTVVTGLAAVGLGLALGRRVPGRRVPGRRMPRTGQ